MLLKAVAVFGQQKCQSHGQGLTSQLVSSTLHHISQPLTAENICEHDLIYVRSSGDWYGLGGFWVKPCQDALQSRYGSAKVSCSATDCPVLPVDKLLEHNGAVDKADCARLFATQTCNEHVVQAAAGSISSGGHMCSLVHRQ